MQYLTKIAALIFCLSMSIFAQNAKTTEYMVPGCPVRLDGMIYQFKVTQINQLSNSNLRVFIQVLQEKPGSSHSNVMYTPPVIVNIHKKPEAIEYYLWDTDFIFDKDGEKTFKTISSKKLLETYLYEGKIIWPQSKTGGFSLSVALKKEGVFAAIEALDSFEGQSVQKMEIECANTTQLTIYARGLNEVETSRVYTFSNNNNSLKSCVTIYYKTQENFPPPLPVIYDIELQLLSHIKMKGFITLLEELIRKQKCLLERAGEHEKTIRLHDAYTKGLFQAWFSCHPEDTVKH